MGPGGRERGEPREPGEPGEPGVEGTRGLRGTRRTRGPGDQRNQGDQGIHNQIKGSQGHRDARGPRGPRVPRVPELDSGVPGCTKRTITGSAWCKSPENDLIVVTSKFPLTHAQICSLVTWPLGHILDPVYSQGFRLLHDTCSSSSHNLGQFTTHSPSYSLCASNTQTRHGCGGSSRSRVRFRRGSVSPVSQDQSTTIIFSDVVLWS